MLNSFIHFPNLSKTTVFIATAVIFFSCNSVKPTGSAEESILEKFSLDGSKNILSTKDFGIINGKITAGINYTDVATVTGIWAPPYVSSNLNMTVRLFGETVKTDNYKWYPIEVQRNGSINGIKVSTSTALVPGTRAVVMKLLLENTTANGINVPLQLDIRGGIEKEDMWGFARPANEQTVPGYGTIQDSTVVIETVDGTIIAATDVPAAEWFDLASHWNTKIFLEAGKQSTYFLAMTLGGKENTTANCRNILNRKEQNIAAARADYTARLKDLFTKLPQFTSSNKELEAYYNRSVLNYLITKWEVDDFLLKPHYGTGGVLGGCVANYLWDFGMAAQLFPLYDPEASKQHIKQFLRIDIEKHFLFDPVKGEADGPWYPANQDKIIELIYYYVMHTGDKAFLRDTVNGITVLDHVVKNAMFGDPGPDRPQQLYNYGPQGEHHLELRRGYQYRGIMPDLNGRRYLNYIKAFELTEINGQPLPYLPERAVQLKKMLKDSLWVPEAKWFCYHSDEKRLRWTNAMYLLINSPVLDSAQREGMISHLNEKEFLGDYGMHSISKIDPAFDQVDFDHGGGGSYVAFPPLIAEQLYNAGYQDAADDVLKRHLWLGQRLPYWGDSHPANYIGYRKDTPLQSAFDASAGAQCVIFGIFGIRVTSMGDIIINPHTPSFSQEIKLKGLKIRGTNIDIEADKTDFKVTIGDKIFSSKIGTPVVYKIPKT